jgi:hypothetical protein
MTGQGRPAAPDRQRRDRRAGGAGAHARAVKKVVFMGMGEPSHNLDNVLEAIELLGTVGNIGHKNLVFSTVGDPRVFERLPQQRVKPALALSLHTTKAELRRELLPRARAIDPPKNWWKRASATPAPPATPSSTSGRCSKASTTATTSSKASSPAQGQVRADELHPLQRGRVARFRARAGSAPPRWRAGCTAAAS